GMRKASSPWWSDAASHRNFFSSERRTRARAPGRAKPRSLNTVAKMRKTWACEPLDLWAAPAGAKIDAALASQTKPTRAIVKRTKVRWPKGERGRRKKSKSGSNLFFFVFFFVIVRYIVPILGLFLFLVVFFFLFVIVIGDGIDFDGMDLHDFHFGFALGTGQDFAFLDFVFVNVNFSSAFRAPYHGENLLGNRVR